MTHPHVEQALEPLLAPLLDLPDAVLLWGPVLTVQDAVQAMAFKHDRQFVPTVLEDLSPALLKGLDASARGILLVTNIAALGETQDDAKYTSVARQLFLDRRVGDHAVPAGWCVWAAASKRGREVASPLTNRFLHIDLDDAIEQAQGT